jgi:hypothetical protein
MRVTTVILLADLEEGALLCLHFFGGGVVLGFELRAYTLSHSTSPFFVMDFSKIGSHELFAWAGFELQFLLISAS